MCARDQKRARVAPTAAIPARVEAAPDQATSLHPVERVTGLPLALVPLSSIPIIPLVVIFHCLTFTLSYSMGLVVSSLTYLKSHLAVVLQRVLLAKSVMPEADFSLLLLLALSLLLM